MANEFARNIQDAALNPAAFALPTQVGEANGKVSAAIDLGADTVKLENLELELSVPALNATMAPAASTSGVYYEIQTSATSTFDGISALQRVNYAGSASGVAAKIERFRLPSNAPRYVRAKVWIGTTATDASAVSATLSVRF